MRAFVAVEIPSPEGAVPRSAAPEHLTLLFLGEVPPERVSGIVTTLTPVAATVAPFNLTLEGVGAFPSPDRPRVVFVGATEGASELGELARRVREGLLPEGTAARAETFATAICLATGTEMARSLFSTTKTTPSLWTDAKFSASWKSPALVPPSPTSTTQISPVRRSFDA